MSIFRMTEEQLAAHQKRAKAPSRKGPALRVTIPMHEFVGGYEIDSGAPNLCQICAQSVAFAAHISAGEAQMLRLQEPLPKSGPRTGLGLRLPFPPTVNHSTRPDGRGGRLLTDKHKAFRASVAAIVRMSPRSTFEDSRLAVEITVSAPNKRKIDLDNRIKAVLDALQHAGVFADDEAIDDLRICRGAIGGNDCFVTINKIPEAA